MSIASCQRKGLPVKLIVGLIFKEENILKKTEIILRKHFGKIDFRGPVMPFIYTDYYRKEFGNPLYRKFISFAKLISPVSLSKIKIKTNKIEYNLRDKITLKRQINIDPGYLDLAKLILATTKDFTHRIYLDNSIYAEVTLFYKDGLFRAWEWTYPDYKTREYIDIFGQIRQIYARQIKRTCLP